MRISDWSSDVCSSDLLPGGRPQGQCLRPLHDPYRRGARYERWGQGRLSRRRRLRRLRVPELGGKVHHRCQQEGTRIGRWSSEEHTSELQSLMRNSYAVFFLTKKTKLSVMRLGCDSLKR